MVLLRILCRSGALLAYGVVAFIYLYAQAIAANVYNEACEKESARYATDPPEALIVPLVVIAVPLLLARSNKLIIRNLVITVLTVGIALILPFSATTPPYECFTSGGDYEDHVSGLGEFALYFIFIALLSYILVLIDLSIWGLRLLGFAPERKS